jgi:hypothetical protein
VSSADTIVEVPDCVFVLYDRASRLAQGLLANELITQSRGQGRPFLDAWTEALEPYLAAGDAAIWLSLLDGVYRVRGMLHSSSASFDARLNDTFLCSGNPSLVRLKCPTGDLRIGSMSDFLSSSGRPLTMVPPGTYLLGLERDGQQETEHAELTTIRDYPPNDGPDWTLHLRFLNS